MSKMKGSSLNLSDETTDERETNELSVKSQREQKHFLYMLAKGYLQMDTSQAQRFFSSAADFSRCRGAGQLLYKLLKEDDEVAYRGLVLGADGEKMNIHKFAECFPLMYQANNVSGSYNLLLYGFLPFLGELMSPALQEVAYQIPLEKLLTEMYHYIDNAGFVLKSVEGLLDNPKYVPQLDAERRKILLSFLLHRCLHDQSDLQDPQIHRVALKLKNIKNKNKKMAAAPEPVLDHLFTVLEGSMAIEDENEAEGERVEEFDEKEKEELTSLKPSGSLASSFLNKGITGKCWAIKGDETSASSSMKSVGSASQRTSARVSRSGSESELSGIERNLKEEKTITSITSITSMAQRVQMTPSHTGKAGGRHDNDHRAYRTIRIIPTREEFMYNGPTYLPMGECNTEAKLLDK